MRVGIIGAGAISKFHVRAIKACGYEVVMVGDIDEKKASVLAVSCNCAYTTESKEVLAQELDLVVISAPSDLHFELASAAMAAGHAVLCEKTLTRSESESRKLVEISRRSGKPFFMGYMKRCHPTMQHFKEQTSRIGIPRSGLVRVYHPFPPGQWDDIARLLAKNKRAFLDGVLVHSGSHILDLLLYVFGPVKRVMSARLQFPTGCPNNDMAAHAMLEMKNGATIMVECGLLSLFGVGRRENGFDEMLQFRGDEGLATLYTTMWDRPELEPPVAQLWHEPSKTQETYNAGSIDYFEEEYKLIAKALAGDSVPLATVEDGYRVDELIENIYTAAGVKRL